MGAAETIYGKALYEVTHRNFLGWADERRNRLTREYQHRAYSTADKWSPGRLAHALKGGAHGRS